MMNSDVFLETRRLRFRPWTDSDAEVLYKYASDPDVGPRAGWPPHQSFEDSLKVIRDIFSNGHTWALVLKETDEPVGCMGYYAFGESNIGIGEDDAELGYWIAKPYWNRGLCTEALHAMIDWCFNKKGFRTLWCDFFEDNPASGRVMAKCGFRETGQTNYLSHLYRGDERPVKIMRLAFTIRPARPDESGLVLDLIRQLAVYEKCAGDVVADEATLRHSLFVERSAEVVFAEENGTVVGFALFFHNFSTFVGRKGMYLEDLFVIPEKRGLGYGKALLKYVARLAVARNCGRMEWICLYWNESALSIYRSIGATPLSDWTVQRLDGRALKAFAEQ